MTSYLACSHVAQQPAVPRHYAMKLAGNDAGGMTVATSGNTSTIDFEFNDRGRGPKLHTVATVDANGIPTALQTTGYDYFKAPVNERFTVANGVASWQSEIEKGESRSTGAFFVGQNGVESLLPPALLKAPNHKLPLLPSGEASIRKLTEANVTANGQTKHVVCYGVSGLDFTPSPYWVDDSGRLFASVSSWAQIVLDGWMDAAPQLLKGQEDATAFEAAQTARRLTHQPPNGTLVVTGARLFDPASMKVTPSTTILVRGNRIEAVGPDGTIAIPDGATRVAANGKTVIPGLWDMHVHMGESDGPLHIANGVTTVRDMANDTDFLLAKRKKFDEGTEIGPRVLLAGIIEGPGPYAGPTKVKVSTEAEAIAAVDKYASLGYEQVKIYSSLKPELVPAIARRTHERGMRLSGHVPAGMIAEQAVRDGYDEIQHANFLLLNFMPDVKETNTPARFTAVAQRAASIDLASPEARAFFDLLKQRHTDIDPTLDVFEGLFVARKGEISPAYAAIADRLPPQVRRGFLTGGLPVPEGMDQRYRDAFKKMLELVSMLHREGIPIVAGTDAMAGFALHRELELYAQAGLTPPEILRLATLGAATIMHHDKDLGSVEQGKLADFDIIDGDPVTNISDVRKVRVVVKDGKVFNSAELDASMGIRP